MPPRLRTLLAWWRWLLIIAYAAAGAALTVATAYRHYDTWVPRTLLRSGFAALHAVLPPMEEVKRAMEAVGTAGALGM